MNIIKSLVKEITPVLTIIINKILVSGEFPQVLKQAVITPVFKNGDKCYIDNYRPISVISNIAKIIEKIIKTRFNKFLNKYKILSKHQFGFREGKSTEDAIVQLIQEFRRRWITVIKHCAYF